MARILLGVSGSIAAYKAADLASRLKKAGHAVTTVMTRSAQELVSPNTFLNLTGNRVFTELFDSGNSQTEHIRLTDEAELVVVAPATANTIAKLALGLADDMLSTTLLAVRCPVLVCPAMNTRMWAHPTVAQNLATLRARGILILEPDSGALACGHVGPGRLAEPEAIEARVESLLREIAGGKAERPLKLLVTAGPTREPIDDVRSITNASSGKLGFALCEAARARGHEVTLVLGPVEAAPPEGIRVHRIETTADLERVCGETFPGHDALVMAAAPADFRVKNRVSGKISKEGRSELTLELTANPDVVAGLGKSKRPDQAIVGFALEAGEGAEARARAKLARKNLDAIVLNGPSNLGSDRASATLIPRTGDAREVRDLSKRELAAEIVSLVEKLAAERRAGR